MFRKSKIILFCVCLIMSVFVVSVEGNAATSMTKTFNVGYAQPYCSDTSGYISVMYYAPGDAHYSLYTYFWTIEPYGSENYSTNVFPQMGITITSNYIKLFPWCHSDSNYFVNICGYDSTDNLVIHQKKSNDVVSGTPFEHSYSGYTIAGYVFGGNAVINTASTLTYAEVPNIIFNSTTEAASMNSYLYQILGAIKDYEGPIYDVLGNVQNIYNETWNMNQKLDSMKKLLEEIKAEQEETNTWLEKIFDLLQKQPETESDIAKSEGQGNLDSANSVMEDRGAGFSDSLGGLVSSMSYNGTECAWEFPTIKLPAIPGVMNEVVLIQKQPIDFAKWVNAIPSGILLVVQSLLTIGLIVYCFKELYDTISYVLTLRGSSNE